MGETMAASGDIRKRTHPQPAVPGIGTQMPRPALTPPPPPSAPYVPTPAGFPGQGGYGAEMQTGGRALGPAVTPQMSVPTAGLRGSSIGTDGVARTFQPSPEMVQAARAGARPPAARGREFSMRESALARRQQYGDAGRQLAGMNNASQQSVGSPFAEQLRGLLAKQAGESRVLDKQVYATGALAALEKDKTATADAKADKAKREADALREWQNKMAALGAMSALPAPPPLMGNVGPPEPMDDKFIKQVGPDGSTMYVPKEALQDPTARRQQEEQQWRSLEAEKDRQWKTGEAELDRQATAALATAKNSGVDTRQAEAALSGARDMLKGADDLMKQADTLQKEGEDKFPDDSRKLAEADGMRMQARAMREQAAKAMQQAMTTLTAPPPQQGGALGAQPGAQGAGLDQQTAEQYVAIARQTMADLNATPDQKAKADAILKALGADDTAPAMAPQPAIQPPAEAGPNRGGLANALRGAGGVIGRAVPTIVEGALMAPVYGADSALTSIHNTYVPDKYVIDPEVGAFEEVARAVVDPNSAGARIAEKYGQGVNREAIGRELAILRALMSGDQRQIDLAMRGMVTPVQSPRAQR